MFSATRKTRKNHGKFVQNGKNDGKSRKTVFLLLKTTTTKQE